MVKPLEKEFKWYLENQEKLVTKYLGKVLVIKNNEIIGVYNNEAEAVNKTSKTEALGTFLVQRCDPGDSSYTQTYHSRVTFV